MTNDCYLCGEDIGPPSAEALAEHRKVYKRDVVATDHRICHACFLRWLAWARVKLPAVWSRYPEELQREAMEAHPG